MVVHDCIQFLLSIKSVFGGYPINVTPFIVCFVIFDGAAMYLILGALFYESAFRVQLLPELQEVQQALLEYNLFISSTVPAAGVSATLKCNPAITAILPAAKSKMTHKPDHLFPELAVNALI
ncbi:hypothetical protein ACSZMN_04455 [Aeromonas veronii]